MLEQFTVEIDHGNNTPYSNENTWSRQSRFLFSLLLMILKNFNFHLFFNFGEFPVLKNYEKSFVSQISSYVFISLKEVGRILKWRHHCGTDFWYHFQGPGDSPRRKILRRILRDRSQINFYCNAFLDNCIFPIFN